MSACVRVPVASVPVTAAVAPEDAPLTVTSQLLDSSSVAAPNVHEAVTVPVWFWYAAAA